MVWYRTHKLFADLAAARIQTQKSQALMMLSHLTDWIEEALTLYGAALANVKKDECRGVTEEALAKI